MEPKHFGLPSPEGGSPHRNGNITDGLASVGLFPFLSGEVGKVPRGWHRLNRGWNGGTGVGWRILIIEKEEKEGNSFGDEDDDDIVR